MPIANAAGSAEQGGEQLLRKLRALWPEKKTSEELDEHYREMERLPLERGDLTAMLIAAFLTIGLPLLFIITAFYALFYLLLTR